MPVHEHRIAPSDVLPYKDYAARRAELRNSIVAVKKNRRLEVGPFATFYFENYDTMWLQVHEMLHIEKGGRDQIAGELETYNPLIPQGHELIATFMLEIEDTARREAMLRKLGGIEETVSLNVGGSSVRGTPTDYEDRTTAEGKTSSVHWIRFPFTPEQIANFRSEKGRVVLEVAHPHYGHMAIMQPEVRRELAKDFTLSAAPPAGLVQKKRRRGGSSS